MFYYAAQQSGSRLIVWQCSKGFPATTVDEVGATADVSKGSFSHHFETKEDLGHDALDLIFGATP